MERELWSLLSQAVSDVDQCCKPCARDRHPTALIVRVYLWGRLARSLGELGLRRRSLDPLHAAAVLAGRVAARGERILSCSCGRLDSASTASPSDRW
jgi:hypothetical protein